MKLSTRTYDTLKRLLDTVVSGLLLVALSPLLLALAILVRVDLGSPIIFSQRRPGRDGSIFTMHKFRSMRDPRPSATLEQVVASDPERTTRLGRALRASSLDELPELWNIFVGDMSFVGPRPLLPEYLPRYNETQARRHEVRPGLTGWAQVNGRNAVSWEERFDADVWYVDNRSLLLDAKIVLMTVKTVLNPSDAGPGEGTTMPPFEPRTSPDKDQEALTRDPESEA